MVMYHVGESYWGDERTCGYGSSTSRWFSTAQGEHLHYRCTVCGYDWTAPTLAAGS